GLPQQGTKRHKEQSQKDGVKKIVFRLRTNSREEGETDRKIEDRKIGRGRRGQKGTKRHKKQSQKNGVKKIVSRLRRNSGEEGKTDKKIEDRKIGREGRG